MRRERNPAFHTEVEADIGVSLRRILAAAIGENHAIGDERRLSLVHVARDPGRRQRRLVAIALHLECGDRALLYFAVLNRRLEFGVFRAPEGREYPTRAVVIPR